MPDAITGGSVGPQAVKAADGAFLDLSLDSVGSLMVSQRQARYQELANRGLVYAAVNAASTSSAALAATYTGGVCISNPAGSTVNLVILKVSGALVVISTAVTTFGLAGGFSTTGITAHTTALVPFSSKIGTPALPTAKADQATTLVGTPTWIYPGIASTGIAAGIFAVTIDVEGSVVVPPGGYVCTATSIASPAAGFLGGISWIEVPV